MMPWAGKIITYMNFHIIDPKTGKNTIIGIPDEDEISDRLTLEGDQQNIRDFFSLNNPNARYDYDFGDGWKHEIVLEAILPKEPKVKFHKCLAGARSCSPEDCGGSGGYEQLLQIIKNPRHPDYREKITWLGNRFNAEHFDATQVCFDSPTKRWKLAFEHGI